MLMVLIYTYNMLRYRPKTRGVHITLRITYIYIIIYVLCSNHRRRIYYYNIMRSARFSILIPRFINFVRRGDVQRDEPIMCDLRI